MEKASKGDKSVPNVADATMESADDATGAAVSATSTRSKPSDASTLSAPSESSISTDGLVKDLAASVELNEILMNYGYRAIIPDPEIFNKYEPETKKALLGFVDREVRAQFDDESRRQDELTQAEIKQSQRGQVFSVLLILVATVAAVTMGILTQNVAMVSAFLALPFVAIIGNLFRPIISRSDKGSQDSK